MIENSKIVVYPVDNDDDGDNCYCVILMEWHGNTWCNSGIVVRNKCQFEAFKEVVNLAKQRNKWV